MRHIVIALFVALPVLAACDNSSPAGPSGTSTWALHADSLTGAGLTCVLSGTVQFNQNNTTLTGNLPGNGVVTECTGPGGPFIAQSAGSGLVNGTLNSAQISFNLDSGAIVASGTVFIAVDSMKGTAMTVTYANPAIHVTGSWFATKSGD